LSPSTPSYLDAYSQRDRDELLLVHAILVASRRWRSNFAELMRLQDGVDSATEGSTSTLCFLGSAPLGLTQVELCELVGVSGPSMTNRLEILERRGLVSRETMVGDRRARLVKILPPGLALLETLIREASALGRHTFEGLDDDSVIKLRGMITDIASRLATSR